MDKTHMDNFRNSADRGSSSPSLGYHSLPSGDQFSESKWSGEQLNLEEVVEDSPMIRDKIRVVEENLDVVSVRIKKICKLMRQIRQASTSLSGLCKQFAEEIVDVGEKHMDESLKKGMTKMGESFAEVETFRELLGHQMENVVYLPLESFVRDIDESKEKRKRVDKANAQYEACISRSSQLKRTQTDKTAETEHELKDAKREFVASSLDLVSTLNNINAKSKIELLEKSTAFMYANLAYYHQGYELYSGMSNYMKDLSAKVQSSRATYEEERKQSASLVMELEKKGLQATEPSSPQPRTSATTYQGYLFKRSTSMRKDWKRRYFVVENGSLKYYRHGKELTPITAMNLLLCTVKPKMDIDRKFCFEVISPDKVYTLQADDQEKMNTWISVIQNGIADLLNQQDLTKQSGFSSPKPQHNNKAAQLELWNQIRAVEPQNMFCADCGMKDPEWASINLGVLFCIDCSGIHRSMGVHISKVRSFTLDKWEPEIIKVMTRVGNANFNKIYEANIPPTIKKLEPTSDRPAREKYIRAKYAEKQFVASTTLPEAELNMRLYYAAEDDKPLSILLYLAQGANPNFVNEDEAKKTPLHIAVFEGNSACTALLVHNRAEANVVDAKLWTPLHYAACFGKTSNACILFKNGAKLEPKNEDGHTPLDLAVATQKADCVTFLRLSHLAIQEQTLNDESFLEALQAFSVDQE